MLAGIAFGSRENDLVAVAQVLMGNGDPFVIDVIEARIPRTVVAVGVGAALALSGLLIQTLTRNPLAEPGLLGISMGASAAMVTASAFWGVTSTTALSMFALPGAIIAALIVYALGSRTAGTSIVGLILSGAVVGAVLTAYVQVIVLSNPFVFDSFRFWIVGSLSGARSETLLILGPVMIVGLALTAVLVRPLQTLGLGESVATSLGVPVTRVRAGTVAAATLLAAGATAAAGPIVFVGLAVPHIVRFLIGHDLRWQVPLTVVLGGSLLVVADVLARVITQPSGLMVGVVTAFLGAPFLLVAVRRMRITP